jgi:parvulin-like peptidyl-prolyl isomerase
MVMSALREKIKIIILVTLLAFVGLIFFEWGMQGSGRGRGGSQSGAAARVNGREISWDSYRRTRQNVLATFEQRTGRSPESIDQGAIEDETWITLIQDAVIQEEIDRHGIRVSDAEILAIMRTSPPDFVRQNFVDDSGQFDPVRYSQALADPTFDWTLVENYIRAVVPRNKLQNFLSLNVRVTSAEVRESYLAQSETVKARHVASPSSSVELPDGAITDDDLQVFYRENRDDFRVGAQAVLDFVRIAKAATAQDSSEIREDLNQVRQMAIEGGQDFATIASRYSDDPSADRGGDLGFIARGDMPSELEDVAFATEIGEISEVFESPFGMHFLKVEDRQQEDGVDRVHIRHVLMRIEPSNTTVRAAAQRLGDFLDAIAEGAVFREAAQQLGLQVETTEPFERDAFIPGIALMRAAHRFAFFNELGATTVDPLEDDDNLYALRLAELREPHIRPFEEVQEAVRLRVEEEKRRVAARKNLQDAIAASDGSLGGIAKALGAEIDTTGEFSRQSFVPGVGRRNAFVANAFGLPLNEVSQVVDTDRGSYVLEVIEKTSADEADFVEQQENIRREILFRKRQAYFQAWLEQQVVAADVIDFRSGIGADWEPSSSALLYAEAGSA